jgi:hypothetical protein
LLAAINTLSIHLKLELAGVDDKEREKKATESRDALRRFLTELQTLVMAKDAVGGRAVTGTDARARELARSYVQARHDREQYRSSLFRKSPADVGALLDSSNLGDRKALLECLVDLRRLLEAHVRADSQKILGEF